MNTLDQAANALDAGLLVIVCTARLSAETQTMVPAAGDTADAALFQKVAIHVSSMKTRRAGSRSIWPPSQAYHYLRMS